jgi:catechol 2,3-dioxygenase-like lactoylglutathione lyase family enzyme
MGMEFSLVELVVSKMAASLDFYRQLGLDIPEDAEGEEHVDVPLAGGVRLAFDTEALIARLDSHWQAPSGGHRIALAFQCDSPSEVDRMYAELVGAGHPGHTEPFDAFWGQRYAIVLDPDGNHVDLYAPTR